MQSSGGNHFSSSQLKDESRSPLRATQKPADNHALVYWAGKDCVSIVALSKFAEPLVVGEACQVHIGKKSYKGTIVQIGTFLYP